MEKLEIIETINKLFIAADERNWEQVAGVFNKKVWLDYTSMSGGEPTFLRANEIAETWRNILPGFDKTHHQLGNYIVNMDPYISKVFCYGTATHFLKNDSGNNIWTVVGTYEFDIEQIGHDLKITRMKFNLKYIDGNSDLPGIAQQRAKAQKA